MAPTPKTTTIHFDERATTMIRTTELVTRSSRETIVTLVLEGRLPRWQPPPSPPRAAFEDAPSLLAMLTTERCRALSPPPTTVDGFERFILGHNERQAGTTSASRSCPPA